jgi:hypothetical protein
MNRLPYKGLLPPTGGLGPEWLVLRQERERDLPRDLPSRLLSVNEFRYDD